jgi:hypothetical protein
MTLADQQVAAVAWNEPDGLMARGTVVVIPGRGEVPAVYPIAVWEQLRQ